MFLGLGLFLGILGAVLIILICNPVIWVYHLSDETADITKQLLLASAVIIIFQSTSNILTKGVLRGGGDTKILMIADSIFLWVVSVQLGYFLRLKFGMTPFWIYMALKVNNLCKMFWSAHRLKSGKWIKKSSQWDKILGKFTLTT
ncbi:MAG: MATE family efflux transporter [Lachnospiraceae bacterium]|nr:MATE family efflux transporter [Lachnospiraceae bacterium]